MHCPGVPIVRVSTTGVAMTILDWAKRYYDRGWCIIPAKLENGKKRAAVRWKRYQQHRPSVQTLLGWFSNGRHEALAVVLGAVSGYLACRDFDDPKAYRQWAEKYPDLATELPTTKTGRGCHVYFNGKVEKTSKFQDGELRGEKSLCVLPPSKHPNGKKYEWIVPLPKGQIPAIDPERAGLIPKEALLQKRTEENRSNQKQSEAILSNLNAVKGVGEDEIETAISVTLPKAFGERNHQVFQLARALRGISALADADPRELRPIVKKWHSLALPHISTKPFEETWIDFFYGWPRVEIPMRLNLLADAMTLGKQNYPLDAEYEQEGLKGLLALCFGLQAIMGDQPFFLSTRTAGRLLSVPHMKAWRWLFLLEQDKWIETVAKGGTKESPYKATRFRYLGRQAGQ